MSSPETTIKTLEDIRDPERTITYGVIKPGSQDENGVLFVRSGDISNGRIEIAKLRKISDTKSNQYKRTILEGGEMLVSLVGSPGNVAIAPAELAGSNIARQVGLVPLSNEVSKEYVKYYFLSEIGKAKLLAQTTGSVQIVINLMDLRNVKIELPEIEVQEKIAGILTLFDNLFELNLKRIKILEEIAQNVYTEWFVRFRYPEHEKAGTIHTPNGPTPKGWKWERLENIAEINARNINIKAAPEIINYVDISSVTTGKVCQIKTYRFEEAPSRARRIVRNGDIIWSTVRPNRKSYALIIDPLPNTIISTGFAVISSLCVPYTYLYSSTTTDGFTNYLSNRTTGAAYPAVSVDDFRTARILIPPPETLDTFHNTVKDYYHLKHKLEKTNEILMQARDLILPKLVSGEINVSEIDVDSFK